MTTDETYTVWAWGHLACTAATDGDVPITARSYEDAARKGFAVLYPTVPVGGLERAGEGDGLRGFIVEPRHHAIMVRAPQLPEGAAMTTAADRTPELADAALEGFGALANSLALDARYSDARIAVADVESLAEDVDALIAAYRHMRAERDRWVRAAEYWHDAYVGHMTG